MRKLGVFSCLLIGWSACAWAQDRAAINGTVTDPAGAVVPGASAEVKSDATGLHRKALTNESGVFEIPGLPVGDYSMTISKTGFRSTTVSGIDLRYGETRTVDTRLEVGGTLTDHGQESLFADECDGNCKLL